MDREIFLRSMSWLGGVLVAGRGAVGGAVDMCQGQTAEGAGGEVGCGEVACVPPC